jgi:hypothetical protein
MNPFIICVLAGVSGLGIASLVEAYKGAVVGHENVDGFHLGGEGTAIQDMADVLREDSGLPPVVCG